MNLYFRLAFAVLLGTLRSKSDPLGETRLRFRVLPSDLDLFTMNNGRYLTIADIGRVDFLARTGVLKAVLKKRWRPMVGAMVAQYRRSLKAFQVYDLTTRILCWDEKWTYIEHRFESGGKLHTTLLIKALFIDDKGRVPVQAVAETFGLDRASPEPPEVVRLWQKSDSELALRK